MQQLSSRQYHYLPGTDLKSRLQYDASGSAYYSYEPHRDLLTQVQNHFNGGVISQYDYVNDAIGRRTAITRSGSMMSETRTDHYDYNNRNELTNAVKNATLNEYAYQYDDIGNRLASIDLGTNRIYTANALNQYTNIVEGVGGFLPQFDEDGNQTLIKTEIGIWSVTYNGENRPINWSCGTTNIIMKFDRMGRRVEYVESENGVTNRIHRFVFDGYLCIQRLDGAANNAVDLAFGWDPTEPIATRPLVLQKNGEYNLFYTHDGSKNVSELVFFQQANGIAAHYEYAPFGAVGATSRSTPVTAYDFREYNPFRFSAEYTDDALKLVSYNYRHLNSKDGRWNSRDLIEARNLYCFASNNFSIDYLGKQQICDDLSFLVGDMLPSMSHEDCISRSIAVPESNNNNLHDILSALNSSVDKTTTISFLFGNHEFINDNGCSFYCIGLTTQVAGISETLSVGNGGSVSVSCGEGPRVAAASAGLSGGSVGFGTGFSVCLIQGDFRLLCISLNSEDNDGCPCANRAPRTLTGTTL